MMKTKKLFAALLICAIPFTAAACGAKARATDAVAATEAAGTAADGDETYKSEDGWSVRYDPSLFSVNELDDHTVSFVYSGESAGANMVEISYVPDKQPEEAMAVITDFWGNDEIVKRSEGFFPGTEDQWGYFRTTSAADNGSGLSQTLIGGEYNGGALMFEITAHNSGDDEKDMQMSDYLAGIVDSVQYENFKPQTMYSYYPGTYTMTDEETGETSTIILNDGHKGTLDFQDKIDVYWGSATLIPLNGGEEMEFTIEGDDLMLKQGKDWITFSKS
jgi:hypothetical protein